MKLSLQCTEVHFASFLSDGYYCHSSKFTWKETGKTHLCALLHTSAWEHQKETKRPPLNLPFGRLFEKIKFSCPMWTILMWPVSIQFSLEHGVKGYSSTLAVPKGQTNHHYSHCWIHFIILQLEGQDNSSVFIHLINIFNGCFSRNRQHHGQTIHPTESFISITLFKLLCVLTWT